MSMRTGLNLNCTVRNKRIPTGYLLNPTTPWPLVVDLLDTISDHVKPSRVRTIIWLAERDPVPTPWLHVPATDGEIKRIQEYAWLCAGHELQLELVIGCLWEALWLKDEFYPNTGPIPDNPFLSATELYLALQSTLWRLLFTGRRLPSDTIIDIYNEFDLSLKQNQLGSRMILWYAWARDAIQRANLYSSLSTIVDVDGKGERAIAAFKWIAELGAGMPSFLEVHVNGVPDEALEKNAAGWRKKLRDLFPIHSIIIGEDDQPRSTPILCAQWIAAVGPLEVIRWVD